MSGTPRVIVAGAGVLGLCAALELAWRGAAVTVCDPGGSTPPNASAVAAGMLAPVFEAVLDPEARPHLDLLLAARDLWPGFAQRAGVAVDRSGAIAVGGDAWLEQVAARFAGLGLRPTEIPARTAEGLAPGLSSGFGRALLTREDWRVDAPGALAALRAAAQAAGVSFRSEAVRHAGEAEALVVATGAGAGLAEAAPELARLSPIKGQLVRFQAPAAGVSVRTEGAYAAPGAALAVGATMEPGRGDTAIDPAEAARLAEAGRRLFPALAETPYQAAAGVRAATADGLPLAGPSAAPGIWLAAGARRNGWLLAPLVAATVATMILGGEPGPHARRLHPGRFG